MQVTFHEWDDSVRARSAAASLGLGEVQVWLATLPPDEADLTRLTRLLSPDESERARRFTVTGPRRQFICGRAWLRQIVGTCLQITPAALGFDRQPHGKPVLSRSLGLDLRFNLSHSGRLVAIALTRGREVGVDLEWIHRLADLPLLAARIFSPREQSEWRSLPPPQQTAAFFNAWTRKEAWLKATGEGLTDTLPAIEVTLSPGQTPEFLALPPGAPATRPWAIHAIPLPPDYAGAVVFENQAGS